VQSNGRESDEGGGGGENDRMREEKETEEQWKEGFRKSAELKVRRRGMSSEVRNKLASHRLGNEWPPGVQEKGTPAQHQA